MKGRRIAFGLILILLVTLHAGTCVLAETREKGIDNRYEMIIDDEADLLIPEEEKMLLNRMQPLTRYGTVVFWTTNRMTGGSESMARDYLSSHVSSNIRFSCTVFMINMSTRQLWIECRGAMLDSFGMNNSYTVTGNVAYKATAQRYYDCADEAFRQMNEIMKGGRILSPMRYLCSVLIALALALLLAYRKVRSVMQPSLRTEDIADAVHTDMWINVVTANLIRETKKAKSSGSSCSGGSSCGGGSSCSSCSSCGGGGGSGF